jgi:hypothetical protein
MQAGGCFVYRLLVSRELTANDAKSMKSIKLKFYPGIDYDFRPESFWAVASNPLEAALRNVKGRQRRAMIRENLLADNLDAIPDYLLNESLDDEAGVSRGQIHPMFMGGEYLPDYGDDEVEIARIELKSTTYDVISLRARAIGSRIKYSLVDEYETEYRLPQQASNRPFSLLELIRFLDLVEQPDLTEPNWSRFGFVLSFNESCLGCGADLEDLRDFTRLDSDYYPDLGVHYSQALEEWYGLQKQAIEDAIRE